MTNKEIAKKIVKYFLEYHNFENNQEIFNALLDVGLSGAFLWDQTPEGFGFWSNLYYFKKLNNSKIFQSFILNNYIINDPNFIEIEFFI